MTTVTKALAAFRSATSNHKLSQRELTEQVQPYATLLQKPGVYRDTVRAVLDGTSDQFVSMTPRVRSQLMRLMSPSAVEARSAFDGAIANGRISATEVREKLQPYVEALRTPGAYRDAVAAVVQGRADVHVTLSPEARAFFRREGLLK